MAKASTDRINKGSFALKKSGGVRQAGQMPAGDGSTSRGATARAGTLASSPGTDSPGPATWKPSFAEGLKQKFRPTVSKSGSGKVR